MGDPELRVNVLSITVKCVCGRTMLYKIKTHGERGVLVCRNKLCDHNDVIWKHPEHTVLERLTKEDRDG